jgi:hypothetical protein
MYDFEGEAARTIALFDRLERGQRPVALKEMERALRACAKATAEECEQIAQAELSDWRGSVGAVERIVADIRALATEIACAALAKIDVTLARA